MDAGKPVSPSALPRCAVKPVLNRADALLQRINSLMGSTTLQSRRPSDADVMVLEGMATLLHDKPFSLSGISGDNGLNDIFLRACRSERNFAIMTAEMDSTYAELVKSEGIIAQDDTAN